MRPLFLLVLAACGSSPTPASHDHAAHAPDHEAHGHATHVAATDGPAPLKLDDGRKWPMDEHTRTAFAEVRTLVAGEVDSPEDARALAAKLDTAMSTLIAGCTMDGEAHDQLHVFLEAFFPAMEQLEEAADATEARARHATMREIVAQYDAHFE